MNKIPLKFQTPKISKDPHHENIQHNSWTRKINLHVCVLQPFVLIHVSRQIVHLNLETGKTQRSTSGMLPSCIALTLTLPLASAPLTQGAHGTSLLQHAGSSAREGRERGGKIVDPDEWRTAASVIPVRWPHSMVVSISELPKRSMYLSSAYDLWSKL
jgi:hypothetical protein